MKDLKYIMAALAAAQAVAIVALGGGPHFDEGLESSLLAIGYLGVLISVAVLLVSGNRRRLFVTGYVGLLGSLVAYLSFVVMSL